MNIRKIIKETILKESAGISFEVREWAKILKNEIDRLVKEADEVEASKSTYEEPEKPITSSAFNYDDYSGEISHFEDLSGGMFDSVIVDGSELMYDAETIKDFPEISNIIKNKVIYVTIGRYGLEAEASGGLSSKYDYVLDDMVIDHASFGQYFYHPDTHNELMAVYEDELEGYQPSYSNYGGYYQTYKPTPRADIQELVINGKDFPEAYEKFSVDKWVFNQAGRIEYDHYKSGYDDNGEYVVVFNVQIRGLSLPAFIHETKHAYDDWNRIRHGGKPIRDSWEVKNIYTKDFEKLILGGASKFPQLSSVVRLYYLGSKLETPAYLENEFDSPGTYKQHARVLSRFNISRFFNKKGEPARGLENEFEDIKNNYDIPFFKKFKNVKDFLEYTQKYFNRRGEDITKRINKALYRHGKIGNQTMINY
tara:strand:- start:3240 stop:4508 length:1269 start_codon:yes stop_codon:yes gene_type:complete